MIKNLKKAFTIIELVIVIAVIAVLAAVMIPTYSSLVEKANQSADIQAVQQINTILIAEESSSKKFESLNEVIPVLNESGIKLDSYTALSNDHKIIWDKKLNRVLYVNNTTNEVVYPEQYKKNSFADEYRLENWVGLDGKMAGDHSWYIDNPATESGTYSANGVNISLDGDTYYKYTIRSAAQLIDLAETLNANSDSEKLWQVVDNEVGSNWIIELEENAEYDMLGAEWEPIMNFDGIFNGNGATIKNIRMTSEELEATKFASWNDHPYYVFGFVSTFTGKYFGNVTLNVDYNCPGNYDKSNNHTVAGAIGAVYAASKKTVYVDSVIVTGSVVNERRAAGIVGYIGGTSNDFANYINGTVVVQKCINEANVESTKLEDSYSTAAGIVSTSNKVSDSGIVEIRGCINNGTIKGFNTAGILANSFIKDAQPKYYIYNNINKGTIMSSKIGNISEDEPLTAEIYNVYFAGDNRLYLYIFDNQYDNSKKMVDGKNIDENYISGKPDLFIPTGNYLY